MEKVFIVEYDNGELYSDHLHYVVTAFRKEEDAQRFIDSFNKLDIKVNKTIEDARNKVIEGMMPQDEYKKLFNYYHEKYYKVYALGIGWVHNCLFYYEQAVY